MQLCDFLAATSLDKHYGIFNLMLHEHELRGRFFSSGKTFLYVKIFWIVCSKLWTLWVHIWTVISK